VFLCDATAVPAADHVKAELLRSCKAVFPTATPHITAADAGVERQRLCIYTATRSVASILDSAVAADYICFVVHASEDMDACARAALAALRVQVTLFLVVGRSSYVACVQGLPSVIWVVVCAPSCNRATLVSACAFHDLRYTLHVNLSSPYANIGLP
jgi:hypothetical protein